MSDARASGLALSWTAPAGCPDGARVRSDVQALSGRDLDTGDAVSVTAVVTQEEAAWLAVVSMAPAGQRPNVRRIEGKTCREVADATAAIIALALVSPQPPEVAPPDVVPPPKAPPRPERPLPRPPPAEEPPIFGGVIGAFAGVDFAALPKPTLGLGLSGALRFFEHNRVELRASGWLPQTEPFDEGSVDVSLFAGTLRYCRVLFGDVASLTACGGVEGGAMVASASGFAQNDSGAGLWVGPEIALGLDIRPVRQLAVGLELEGLALIARDAFLIDEIQAYRPGPVDGRLLLGVSFAAP